MGGQEVALLREVKCLPQQTALLWSANLELRPRQHYLAIRNRSLDRISLPSTAEHLLRNSAGE